jgi:hypothetical protein
MIIRIYKISPVDRYDKVSLKHYTSMMFLALSHSC